MAQPRKLHDRFFKQAKADGFAARSAYKLLEIQERKRVIRRGDRVLDLGCAPGSWLQAAGEVVGPGGEVVGVDLKPVTIQLPRNTRTIVADIFKIAADGLGNGQFDVILSDMAPNTEGGGGRTTDHFRSIELCRRALELAGTVLRPGGNLVMKVFEGEAYAEPLRDTAKMFDDVKGFKPEASRDVSREMYVIAKGFKATAPSTPAPQTGGVKSHGAPTPRPGWGERS